MVGHVKTRTYFVRNSEKYFLFQQILILSNRRNFLCLKCGVKKSLKRSRDILH
jgi:hypothetical protein